MAKKLEDLTPAVEFLKAELSRSGQSGQDEEFREKIKEYVDRIAQGDTEFECFISVIHVTKGIQILDHKNAECLIVAWCERSVRDFMRCVPNYEEMIFYFSSIYYSVVKEYLYSDDLGDHPDHLTGIRKANAFDPKTRNQKSFERVIGTKKDDIVSEFKKLTTLKARIETGHVVMEGFLMVNRSLKDNLQVEKVVYAENIDPEQKQALIELCEKSGIPYYRATQGIMAAMTTTNPVPEVICSVRVKACSQEELIISDKKNFFLILDGISNPDNLGMVLRTADASGVDAVILLSPSVHHFNKNSIRGGRGAVGRIPIYFCSDDFKLMDLLHEHGFRIWGTSARFQASNFYDVSYDCDNIAVIVGNESNGVRKEILDKCTDYVKIPMVDGQSSLNIAVAAALVMYEYDREFYQ